MEEENEDQITKKVKNVLTRNLGFDEEEVQEEFNKCHRVGPVKDGQQTTIFSFKFTQIQGRSPQTRKTTKNEKN